MTGQEGIYERVNTEILAALDQGVVPWRRPWSLTGPLVQRNGLSGHVYRGVNVFLLSLVQSAHGYSSPRWVTFRQAQALGGSVKAGMKGTPVVFWKVLEIQDRAEDPDHVRKIPTLRYYVVFNIDQCEGLRQERLVPVNNGEAGTFTPLEQAERIVQGYADPPPIRHGGNQAYWVPSQDRVQVPRPVDFESPEAYYGTLFHELTHSTGHAKRLGRDGIRQMGHFGDELYAREELVAEMGSAFLQAHAAIDDRRGVSAAYLQNWMKAIRGDRKLLVVAAAQAQKAAEWVLGRRPSPNATAGEDTAVPA